MADNNQPTEKPNKIEEDLLNNPDGSPITAEQRHDSDNRFDVKTDNTHTIAYNNEPAKPDTIAGSDQFGLDAASNNDQNRRIQELNLARLDTPQFASDTQDFEDNPYGNDQKAALKQFNGAESGSLSSGMVAGTMQAEIRKEQLADLEQKRREDDQRFAAYAALTSLQQQLQEIAYDLGKLEEDAEKNSEDLNEATITAREQLKELNDKTNELEELKQNQELELTKLERDYAQATSEEEKTRLAAELELKRAEVENTTANLNFATNTHYALSTSLKQAHNDRAEYRRQIDEIKSQLQEAESNGDRGKAQELRERLKDAQMKNDQNTASIEDLKKKIEVATLSLKATQSAHKQSMSCDFKIEDTLAKASSIRAATKVVDAMSEASTGNSENGSALSSSEIKNIVSLAKKAGLDQSEFNNLAQKAADAGLLTDATGTRLTSSQASALLDAEWNALSQELVATNIQLDQKSNEASAILNEIAQDRKTIAQTTALIAEKTTTGSLESQAAAKIGAAVIGENMSIRTDVIKDTAGNAVYADRSGAETTYYYMDKDSGQRVDYKADDLQVLNFKMGKDGSAPLRSEVTANSSPLSSKPSSFLDKLSPTTSSTATQPVKVFANDKVDGETYQAKFDQKDAQKSLQENEQKFASVSSEISSLQEKGMLLKSDIESLIKIRDAQKAGTISSDDALTQLTELKNNAQSRSLAASSTNTTSSAGADTRTASETLELNTPNTLAQAKEMEDKIKNVTSITPEGIERLKEEAAEYGISEETVEDTLAANDVKIEKNTYAESTPQQSPAPTRSVNFAPIGVTTQTPIIASYTPQATSNGVLGGRYQSFADSPEFAKTNSPNASDSPTFKTGLDIQQNPVAASSSFGDALIRPDPTIVAAEEARKRLEQEEALRLAQQQLASRPSSGGGLMSGASTSG